jgi:hypothetical protein
MTVIEWIQLMRREGPSVWLTSLTNSTSEDDDRDDDDFDADTFLAMIEETSQLALTSDPEVGDIKQYLMELCNPMRKGRAGSTSTDAALPEALQSLTEDLKNGGLTTILRPYQLQGVRWLFNRMRSVDLRNCDRSNITTVGDTRWDGWVRLSPAASPGSSSSPSSSSSSARVSEPVASNLWYNIFSEVVATSAQLPPSPQLPPSAVLADEMGIGKSLQVLSLVLMLKLRGAKDASETSAARELSRQLDEAWSSELTEDGVAGVGSCTNSHTAQEETKDFDNGARKRVAADAFCTSDLEESNRKKPSGASRALTASGKSSTSIITVASTESVRTSSGKNSYRRAPIINPLNIIPEGPSVRGARARARARLIEMGEIPEDIDDIPVSTFPCICGRKSESKEDKGWVQCTACQRWNHTRCCGFASADEAKVRAYVTGCGLCCNAFIIIHL